MTNFIRRFKNRVITSFIYRVFINRFEFWQSMGLHIVPVDFSSPMPDTRQLAANYPEPSELPGIDMNDAGQIAFLDQCTPFQDEYNAFVVLDSPTQEEMDKAETFVLNNPFFRGIDPHVYYCMIRHYKPNRIIEVGSGNSTRVARMALEANGSGELACIEPYPTELLKLTPGIQIIQEFVENVELATFEHLEANDILFIDSSHVLRVGGDVEFLFLEVLPRLKPGVIVHVHDIFLPQNYLKVWVVDQHRFYTEQQILQAYLIGNSKVEIRFANNYMALKQQDLVAKAFPKAQYYVGSGSFWFQTR